LFILLCLSIALLFFFLRRRLHTISKRDCSSDVCSSDLHGGDSPLDVNGIAKTLFLHELRPAYAAALLHLAGVHEPPTEGREEGRSEERRVGTALPSGLAAYHLRNQLYYAVSYTAVLETS